MGNLLYAEPSKGSAPPAKLRGEQARRLRTRLASGRFALGFLLSLGLLAGASRPARADVVLHKAEAGGWELFTDGRINTFFSYTNGDG
jgi:hypothetical protein